MCRYHKWSHNIYILFCYFEFCGGDVNVRPFLISVPIFYLLLRMSDHEI